MKKLNCLIVVFLALTITIVPAFAQKANKLSKQEKKEGWELLFNGKNFDGWRQYNGDAMPANWIIENGAMKVFLENLVLQGVVVVNAYLG